MKYTHTIRLRVLFFTSIFLAGTLACGSSSQVRQAPKASDTPQANLNTCLPHPDHYRLEITNLSDQSNQTMRSCNARGSIINEGTRELMYRVYRVNHYGAEETFGEEWLGAGFQVLKAGESSEYGRFHRCTGGNCGEGEWFYIEKISLYYADRGCLNFALNMDEPHPESIILIENPCDW
jgi:hypothetical protein